LIPSKRVDFDGGGGSGGEGSLGMLTGGTETTKSTRVGGEILLVLALELLDEVVDEPVVEALTTQVGVTSGGLDLGNTLLDGQEGGIESSFTKIEDEDVALTGLLIETIGNGGSSRLIDDTENVQVTDGAGVLGGLTLGVVEVSGDGNDGVSDGTTEVGLGGLSHLGQDHGGDCLGRLNAKLESRSSSVEEW
jgi:hypothetical protein